MSTAKQKIKKKPLNTVDSDEDSEHELFYYANDRIKLMKEVLKLIKPKKIKSIAPDFMKNLDIDEINSTLLEELLGISNKRLKHILNGEKVDIDSSSSESEQEQKPIDIISLDDISDTDDEFGLGSTNSNMPKVADNKHKEKPKQSKTLKDVKSEKGEQSKKKETHPEEKVNTEVENDKLMNVLEILELQARARAIRSQLALENVNKKMNVEKTQVIEDDDDVDAVIVSSPRHEEIVITSESDDDKEHTKSAGKFNDNSINSNGLMNDNINTSSNNEEQTSIEKENEAVCGGRDILDDASCSEEQLVPPNSAISTVQNSDMSNIVINCNSNTSVENESKEDVEEKNNAPYKSDSDNDVINLDSEDIENV